MSLQDLMNKPQMNAANNAVDVIGEIVSMFKNGNPNMVFQQLLMSNPMVQDAKKMADQCGGWEQAARTACQQRGLDVNEVFQKIQNMYKKNSGMTGCTRL